MRTGTGQHCLVLGGKQVRPVGRWNESGQFAARTGVRAGGNLAERRRSRAGTLRTTYRSCRHRRGKLSHLRAQGGWRCAVLGRQRLRPVGGRDVRRQRPPSPGVRDGPDRSWSFDRGAAVYRAVRCKLRNRRWRPQLRCDGWQRPALLGRKQLWPAGRRHKLRPVRAGSDLPGRAYAYAYAYVDSFGHSYSPRGGQHRLLFVRVKRSAGGDAALLPLGRSSGVSRRRAHVRRCRRRRPAHVLGQEPDGPAR
jgi:hypothetical protein